MANIKISQLPGAATVSSTDIFPFVAIPGYTTQQAPLSALANLILTGTANAANTAGTVTTAIQSNITSIGNGATGTTISLNGGNTRVSGNLIVVGNLTVPNINITSTMQALQFIGNGFPLTSTNGANVSGQVADSYLATFLVNPTQPNLTIAPNLIQVGNLGNLRVDNNLSLGLELTSTGNASFSGNVTANYFIGNGASLTNLNGSNVIGAVPSSLVSTIAGTVTTAAQPNITSVGVLNTVTVSGNATVGGLEMTTAATANTVATVQATVPVIINGITYKLMLSV